MLVVDTEHLLVLTGGTQPDCSRSSELYGKTTKAIEDCRIGGTEYAAIIQKCSRDFAMRAANVKALMNIDPVTNQFSYRDSSEINERYEAVVTSSSPNLYDKVPSTKDGKMIFCWAFEGKDFSPKRPCIRCQSLYPTWTLHNPRPGSDAGKRESLEDIQRPHLVPSPPLVDPEFTYCAETIAATKLYLLRHGTVALV